MQKGRLFMNKINSAMKSFLWHSRRFYKKSLIIGDGKTTASKFKTFAYSLLIGGVIIMTMLWIFTGNPFETLPNALEKLSSYKTSQDRMLVNVAVFGLAGVAVAVGFKTGLFNMGVSGQMVFAGLIAGLVALHAGANVPNGAGQILIILMCILSAATFAAISGILKAYFRIHEVVSTIMLNWIAFLLMQAVLKNYMPDNLLDAQVSKQSSVPFSSSFTLLFDVNGIKMGGIAALCLLAVTAIGIWVVLYKTNLGHKMQMVGKNKEAALAAGVNVKLITVASMALSGAAAGVLAVVTFFIRDLRLNVSKVDAIAGEGFNGIAIAILAFSNPFAIIPVAFIFGLLQALIVNSVVIDNNFIDLSTGLLLLIAAMNTLFIKFNVRMLIYKLFMGKHGFENYLLYKSTLYEIDKKSYENYDNLKMDKKLNDFNSQIWEPHRHDLKNLRKDFRKKHINMIRQRYNWSSNRKWGK